jgi:hypothetical protein
LDHLFATAAWISIAARCAIGLACWRPRAARPSDVVKRTKPSTRYAGRAGLLLFTNLWMVIACATWAADAVIQS